MVTNFQKRIGDKTMTREEAKEWLPIIQAFAEGKTIQFRERDIEEPSFDGCLNEYRIKPEPKYRPFKSQEECWQEMLKHQPFGWVKNKATNILYNLLHIYKNKVGLGIASGNFVLTVFDLFEYYVFIDGIPFGIKEEYSIEK